MTKALWIVSGALVVCVFIIYCLFDSNKILKQQNKQLVEDVKCALEQVQKTNDINSILNENKQQTNKEKQEDIFNEKNSDTNSLVDNFTNRLHLIQKDSM